MEQFINILTLQRTMVEEALETAETHIEIEYWEGYMDAIDEITFQIEDLD